MERRRWTAEEDAYLLAHREDAPHDVGTHLGRSRAAVILRRHRLVTTGEAAPRQAVRADQVAIDLEAGMTQADAARKHGVSRQRIQQIAVRYGVGHRPRMHSTIRAARRHAGRTQADVAAAVGVTPEHYARIESGELEAASTPYDRISRVAAELGLDPDGLFALEGRIPDDIADVLRRDPVAVKRVRAVLQTLVAERVARGDAKVGGFSETGYGTNGKAVG